MSTRPASRQFKKLSSELKKITNDSLVVAYNKFAPAYQRRIFTNGLDSTNKLIGEYSTKPTYVSVDGFKRRFKGGVKTGGIKPKGKDGKSKFKNGKTKKSMYLAKGYSQLRDVTGRQNDKVDLNFTGNLSSTLRIGRNSGRIVYGFVNSEGYDLSLILARKYRKRIFEVSISEEKIAVDTSEKYVIEKTTQIIDGIK